jgi:hypothetical protein
MGLILAQVSSFPTLVPSCEARSRIGQAPTFSLRTFHHPHSRLRIRERQQAARTPRRSARLHTWVLSLLPCPLTLFPSSPMPRWTPEARQKQSTAIRQWRPWTLSTGPQTSEGRVRSSRNAWKGGHRAKLGHWRRALRSLEEVRLRVISSFRKSRSLHQAAQTGSAASLSASNAVRRSPEGGGKAACLTSGEWRVALTRLLAGSKGGRTG